MEYSPTDTDLKTIFPISSIWVRTKGNYPACSLNVSPSQGAGQNLSASHR